MELLSKHREIERGAGELNRESLEFDPDKLIEPGAPEPESALSDPEYVAEEVEGLSLTNQEMRILDNGNTLYDSPNETGKLLNSEQGRAVPDIQGDCGLVSCENIARMAGKNVTEADVIRIAREGGLCLDGCRNPADNGGDHARRHMRGIEEAWNRIVVACRSRSQKPCRCGCVGKRRHRRGRGV